MSKILLFSGGIDSLIAWFYLDKPKCIYIDLHTEYSEKEIKSIKNIATKLSMDLTIHEITNLNLFYNSDVNAFVPNRNLLLALIGSWYGDEIFIAGIKGDMVEDKNPEAFTDMTEILNKFSRTRIKIDSPFWQMSKTDIIKWFIDSGYDKNLLFESVSCYHKLDKPCGNCGSCVRKYIALKMNNIEPDFEINETLKLNYLDRARSNKYDISRNNEIIKIFGGNC